MPARTFRQLTSRFWNLWPISPVCDEIHHVVHVDGISIGSNAVVLIACTADHVIGWYFARSECSQSWAALMARIAPPDIVVCDGGNGFEKARRAVWPQTRVQRCLFHVFEQVKRCTTTHPRLQAGVEIYALSKKLMHIHSLDEAATWIADFSRWYSEWDGFLKERIVVEGRSQFKHEPLRKARRSLEKLVRQDTLFTYLDEVLPEGGLIPSTNNRIEGGVNSQIRRVLGEHRGLNMTRRAKATFWWCYMHTECPLGPSEILEQMPDDEGIVELYRQSAKRNVHEDTEGRWGTAVVWGDFHTSGPYRNGPD